MNEPCTPFCVLGIDPGLSGAMGFMTGAGLPLSAWDIPIMGEGAKKIIDGSNMALIIGNYTPVSQVRAIVELVGSQPGEGVSSAFRFGQSVGTILGVLAALRIPVTRVAPGTWKKDFNLIGQEKEQSRLVAIQRWPSIAGSLSRKKDHNRAESLLIAEWGRKHAP